MVWFSVWLPLLLQGLVPLLLIGWIAAGRFGSRASLSAAIAGTLAYLSAIAEAGLWLVLPWCLPFVYGAALAYVSLRAWPRGTSGVWPPSKRDIAVLVSASALAVAAGSVTVGALAARRPPAPTIDLTLPLESGTYLAVNAGGSLLVNAHLATLEGERFRPYRGQSYGVDLARINGMGFRARGILPGDPGAYLIFGDPVLAPCDGRVVAAVDGAPDMPPPQADRAHMAGNHVILECGSAWVVLGHLQRGSVAVREGERVRARAPLGLVGNSGNTGEPHLHVHAQRPGTAAEPLSGAPVPVRLGGRFVVRNDRVHSKR